MLIRSKHGLEIQERILQCGQVHALQDSFFVSWKEYGTKNVTRESHSGGEKVCRKGS